MFRLVCLLVFLSSCQTLPHQLDFDSPKKTLKFSVNGKAYRGIAVVDSAPASDLKLEPGFKPSYVGLTSCQRDVDLPQGDKVITYRYEPGRLESGELTCPVNVAALSDDGLAAQYASIYFRHPTGKATATLDCNGRTTTERDIAVCHAREGTLQGIKFAVTPTEIKTTCQPLTLGEDGWYTYYSSPTASCLYIVSIPPVGEEFRFFADSYTGVPYVDSD